MNLSKRPALSENPRDNHPGTSSWSTTGCYRCFFVIGVGGERYRETLLVSFVSHPNISHLKYTLRKPKSNH